MTGRIAFALTLLSLSCAATWKAAAGQHWVLAVAFAFVVLVAVNALLEAIDALDARQYERAMARRAKRPRSR